MAEAWSTGLKAAELGKLAGPLVGGLPQFPTFVRLTLRLRCLVKKMMYRLLARAQRSMLLVGISR